MGEVDRTKFKPARERARDIAALAANGMTSCEIADTIGEISPRRVRAIAHRYHIKLARPGARRFGTYLPDRNARVLTELADAAQVSPATMLDRITRVVLDDGIEHARRRLGKLALPTRPRP
ncbi:hypothetical protein [Bosea sp. ASV33]|uniref:hypothetical protein n=1 Tax=Bosea sp. ASV33 TaxID=2795106 RepID=UPI001AEE93C8|nr:hypothetical protein [Bosea sp. ASV33]